MAFTLGILVGLSVAGGALMAYWISHRQRPAAAAEPSVPDSADTEALLSAIPQSHIMLDESNQVLRASSIAYAFGLIRERALRPELLELAARARDDGKISDLELRLERSDGAGEQRLWVRATPVSGDHVLILFQDNTEKRRLEEMRRDFVANVSHELKTPVGAIRLLAETITEVADEPEHVRHFAGQLEVESERLANLVQEIIQLSRLQDGNILAESEFVAVDDVVAEAVDRVKMQAAAANVRVISGGSPGLEVYGSPAMLTTAVRNLLDNAIRYSRPHTQVSVGVGADAGEVQIAVVDQGEGIPRASRERIFERFYRGDKARSRETGGSGLGLSIVKHVAADHGGRVKLWSEQGQGSTFTLVLPQAFRYQDDDVQADPGSGRIGEPLVAVAGGSTGTAAQPALAGRSLPSQPALGANGGTK